MKIINKNVYNVMFNMDFIKAGEIKEIEDSKIIKLLLNQPGIEEYVDIEELKELEEENKKLKEQLSKSKTTSSKSKSSKSK